MTTAAYTLLAVNARDRVDAVHSYLDRPGAGAWWVVMAAILLGIAVAVFLAVILLRRSRDAKRRKQYRRRVDDAGIKPEEQKLLAHMANLAGLKQAGAVLDAPEAFERAADALMRSQRVSALDADLQTRVRALVNALRDKLGFERPGPFDLTAGSVWLGKIPAGTALEVVRPASPETFKAVLAGEESATDQIVLEPTVTIRCEGGEPWTIRYAEGGLLWEFDARVVCQEETGRVVVLPDGKVRCVNRRRFVRTPVDIPAFVAPYPFVREAADDGMPRFLPATLVEIAGPGLRVEAPLEFDVGERMLVGLRVNGKVMQALGITRRPSVVNVQGVPEVVAELVGLTATEVTELVRVSNAAAQASRPQRGSEPAGAPAGARRPQPQTAAQEA